MEIPFCFALDVLRPGVQLIKALLDIQLLRAAQALHAQHVHPHDVHFLKLTGGNASSSAKVLGCVNVSGLAG